MERKIRFLGVLVCVLAAFSVPAQAQVSGFQNNYENGYSFGGGSMVAVRFIGPSGNLNEILFKLMRVGSPSAATVELRSGSQSGTILFSGTVGGGSIPNGRYADVVMTVTGVVLGASVNYYLVFSASGDQAQNYYILGCGNNGSKFGTVTGGGFSLFRNGAWMGEYDILGTSQLTIKTTPVSGGSSGTVQLSANSLDFVGNVNIGQPALRSFSIKNTGGAAVSVSNISSNSGEFTIAPVVPPSISLSPGDSLMVTVTFTPVSVGSKTAAVAISHNAPGGVLAVVLNGVGVNGGTPVSIFGVAPTALAMDTTNVGSSSQKVLAVSNTGTASLSVASVTVSGADASSFGVLPTTATVAAGANQIFTVTFAPSSAGAKSASLAFTHNAAGGPSAVMLNGAGKVTTSPPTTTPLMVVSPTAIGMDTVNVGSFSQKTFTVSNTGGDTLVVSSIARSGADSTMFAVSPAAFTVSPGGLRTVTVSFAPTSTGSKATVLGVYYNAVGSPFQVVVSGVGKNGAITVAPVIAFPASLTLDSTGVGSSSQKTATIANTGTASLAVTAITVSGADANMFSVSPVNAAVAADGNQILTVRFAPTSVGAKSAALVVTHNADGSPDTITVSGVGKTPPPAPLFSVTPATLAMDPVFAGSTSQKIFTVSNPGALALNVSVVTVSGTDASQFSVLPTIASVGAGASQIFIVTFAPTSAGVKSASLKLTHNAAGSPDSVRVSGVGRTFPPTPLFNVTPAALAMDTTSVGATSQKIVTASNHGTAALNISSVAVSGVNASQFSVLPASANIGAGGSQFFIVTFSPDSVGAKSASLVFTHNAAGSPDTVVVSGAGRTQPVTPPPSGGVGILALPGLVVFPDSTAVGDIVPRKARIWNVGTGVLILESVSSSSSANFGANTARFPVTLAAGDSILVDIVFMPQETGQLSATLTVNSSAGARDIRVLGKGFLAGQPGLRLSAANVVVDTTVLGQKSERIFTIQSVGTAPLKVSGITFGGSDAAVFSTPQAGGFTLALGDSQTVKIIFSPTAAGQRSVLMILTTNTALPAIVSVTGVGISPPPVKPEIKIFPADSLDLGPVSLGESDSARVIITNPGRVDLNLAISIAGKDSAEFSVRPRTLYVYPDETRACTVVFTPKSPGPKAASVVVEYTPTDTVLAVVGVAATGVGTIPPPVEEFLPEDFNRDGKVDMADFLLLAKGFNSPAEGGNVVLDLNKDGQVNFGDFILFSKVFGKV